MHLKREVVSQYINIYNIYFNTHRFCVFECNSFDVICNEVMKGEEADALDAFSKQCNMTSFGGIMQWNEFGMNMDVIWKEVERAEFY